MKALCDRVQAIAYCNLSRSRGLGQRLAPLALFFTLNRCNMATFRVVPTGIWADDIFLSMSPEQKMIMLYLHTCPSATQCGIYKLPIKTMGFHLGFTHQPVENALRGLCSAFADLVAYDEHTGEIALLQHPKNVLTNASPKIWKQVIGELQNVQSGVLLQKVMSKNSATANAPYLNRYRQLHIESVNNARKYVQAIPDSEVYNGIENQIVNGEIEREIEREIESKLGEVKSKDFTAKKKTKDSLNLGVNMVALFDEYMTEINKPPIVWKYALKEVKAVYEICKKLSVLHGIENTVEEFKTWIRDAYEVTNDEYIKANFTPAVLNSQFDRINQKIKNPIKNNNNGQRKTTGVISQSDFAEVVATLQRR